MFFLFTVVEDEAREGVPSLTGTLIIQQKWTFDIVSLLKKHFIVVHLR